MSRYAKRKIQGRTFSVHRLVMAEKLGRELGPGEVVHHIDHNPWNNDPGNLMVMTHAEHAAHHNNKHSRSRVCDVCGDDYEPHPTKRARSRTCSRDCFRTLCSVISKEREKKRYSRVILTCRQCDRKFDVVRNRATVAKFCSQPCAADAKRLPW